jgi:hypothetical protein
VEAHGWCGAAGRPRRGWFGADGEQMSHGLGTFAVLADILAVVHAVDLGLEGDWTYELAKKDQAHVFVSMRVMCVSE